jgi:hypothetical protein
MQNVSSYYNLSIPDSFVIPIQYAYINLLKTGQLPANAVVAAELVDLNQYTNSQYSASLYSCNDSQDTWQLNSINCTVSEGEIFLSNDSATFDYGSPTCMSFNQYANFQPSDRYNNKYQSCAAQNNVSYDNFVMGFIGGFQNHLTDMSQVFGDIQNDLDTVNSTNEQFMQEARSLAQPLLAVNSSVLDILNLVGNDQTGLMSNFNCAFLKSNGQDVIDHLCIAYLPDLFLVSACIVVFTFLALIALFPVYLLEKMFKLEKKRDGERLVRKSDQRIQLMEAL